jgi:outer membrane autotransporter protein
VGTGLPGSDRLVIDGATATASGTTSVQVATLGGLGAPTTGDGIEVISARNGATTTAQTTRSAFSLAGGHVDAGAYEYRLQAGNAQGAGENWYLRTTTPVIPPIFPPIIPPVIPPVVPPGEVLPPGESGPPPVVPVTPPTIPPPVQVPTYRAEVPMLAALPEQLRQADLAMLGNLHRRMGDEAPGASGTDAAAQSPSGLAEAGTRRAWARLVYADLAVEQPGLAQPRTDLRVSGLQAGTDLLVMGAWRAGVYVGYLDGNAGVSGNAHGVTNTAVGSNDLSSRFLGTYATWMDATGWYVDSVLQAASHHYEVRPDGNPSVSGTASGFTASVEGGKAFALTDRWSIEPQAQLAWQHNSFDDLLLTGARVRQDSGSGWIARLGLRIKGDLPTAAGRLQPYARVNFYHANFSGDAALFIGPAASTSIASEGSYSAGEVSAGATLALTSVTSLYGEIGHQWNIGGDASVKSSVQGSLGIKVRW